MLVAAVSYLSHLDLRANSGGAKLHRGPSMDGVILAGPPVLLGFKISSGNFSLSFSLSAIALAILSSQVHLPPDRDA